MWTHFSPEVSRKVSDDYNRDIETFLSPDLFKEKGSQDKPLTTDEISHLCRSTSTFRKKAKKTKKPINRDQFPTLQRLIRELTTTDPEDEEILQTEPASESNNDSNVFLNLYNKIVA
ncbi:12576_t:CDS:2, partial [Funneliformis mosseae]